MKYKIKYILKKIIRPINIIKGKILLKHDDFTIISNNCWGGIVYKEYGLKYSSPTVGVYFFAEEYIRFLKNLEYYTSNKLKFIPSTKSKYYDYMIQNNLDLDVLVGIIDDVEIVFLHYKDEEEAIRKWNRRCSRINWEKMIIKFNDQNLCNYDLIKEFDSMNYKNKICFTSTEYENFNSVICFNEFENESFVKNDTKKSIYKKYINTTKYINCIK